MPCQRLLQELRDAGICDENVLNAIAKTPRERFLPESLAGHAYENRALPIAADQTISQPYIVAAMTSALRLQGSEHILEIGTGSGYQAAILAKLCRSVVTIERHLELSTTARATLATLGATNINFQVGDGTRGYEPAAPYDGIVVTAAAPGIPDALWNQLKTGGIIVIPVGDTQAQELLARTKTDSGYNDEQICGCRFVKLIGAEGWPQQEYDV